jgi:hypothetical protein
MKSDWTEPELIKLKKRASGHGSDFEEGFPERARRVLEHIVR